MIVSKGKKTKKKKKLETEESRSVEISKEENLTSKGNLLVALFISTSIHNLRFTEKPKVNMEIMSNIPFDILHEKISKDTLEAITEMGFKNMTKIQMRCIPQLLMGKDLVGAAKTGSGKTLAFLVPAIELVAKLNFKPKHGTGALIISPTRELAIQIYGVLTSLMVHHTQSFGLVIGGVDRFKEVETLKNGVNILVATPGRLLDHLHSTTAFKYNKLKCLIIDEADRILDIGFEEAMKQILSMLPKERQTILFSATQTEKTKALTTLAFQNYPLYIGVNDEEETSTVTGLEQFYAICPTEKRFLFLYSFLKTIRKKKVMVFFSSCMSVCFHKKFFDHINVPISCIHVSFEILFFCIVHPFYIKIYYLGKTKAIS